MVRGSPVKITSCLRTKAGDVPLPAMLRFLQRFEFPHKLGICEKLFSRELAAKGVCWVSTAAGISWKLDLRNATHRWIVYGKYEGAPFLSWARSFLPPDGIVVDAGANVGQMLLYLAQWVPQGRVVAIEPGKHQADWLEECLRANQQLPVELVRAGLGARATKAFLEETGPADRHGSWNRVSKCRGEPIELVPLENLLNERKLRRVHLWKLDVEGYEVPALQGAGKLLSGHQIEAIYVELRGENGCAIRDFLKSLGYQCHIFSSGGRLLLPDRLPEDTNGLFLARNPRYR
jgi:FkbM family methyltransferase